MNAGTGQSSQANPRRLAAITLRRATVGDVQALAALEQQIFSGDRLSPRQFRHHATAAGSDLMLAVEGVELRGYALLLARRGSRLARLYSIAVAPEARGLGLGARLLAAAEDAARARDRSELRLEVRIDNRAAIALYEAHGYQVFGRRQGYYEDGCDALRMARPLPPANIHGPSG